MRITGWNVYAPDTNFHVLLELQSDQGHSGWGAGYSQRDQMLGALQWLKRFVINENPLQIERAVDPFGVMNVVGQDAQPNGFCRMAHDRGQQPEYQCDHESFDTHRSTPK